MLDGQLSAADYKAIKSRYEPIIESLVRRHLQTNAIETELKRYLRKGLMMIQHLRQSFENAVISEKQRIVRSVLKENITIQEMEGRTQNLNELLRLIAVIISDNSGLETKTGSLNGSPSRLVIPPRLERGTYSLEGYCSIQLSYETKIKGTPFSGGQI